MNIHKGEQYAIPFAIKVGDDDVTPENVSGVRIQIGDLMCEYPDGQLQFDSEEGTWLYPLTEDQSYSMYAGVMPAQVALKYGDDIVMSDIITVSVRDSIIQKRWSE
jgi:hypothetical protein